jgi:hypothetical protein
MFPTKLLKAKLTKRFNTTSAEYSTKEKLALSLLACASVGFIYGLRDGCDEYITTHKQYNMHKIDSEDLMLSAIGNAFHYTTLAIILPATLPVTLPVAAYIQYRINKE